MSEDDPVQALCDAIHASLGHWLSAMSAKHLPPEVYLRAYGNEDCKRDVAAYLQEHGFKVRAYDDRHEMWRNDELLGTWVNPLYSRRR